jgi:hypothetical protein
VRWPNFVRLAVFVDRCPSIASASLELTNRLIIGAPAASLAQPLVMLLCHAIWVRADLLRQSTPELLSPTQPTHAEEATMRGFTERAGHVTRLVYSEELGTFIAEPIPHSFEPPASVPVAPAAGGAPVAPPANVVPAPTQRSEK